MEKIAFTICAKNYLGLAQLLENTINSNNENIKFFIFIADEFSTYEELPANVIIAKNSLNIPFELWNEMSFKYDLTEFCTAIKPYCFNYLFKHFNNNAKCLYFDPDIVVFNSLESIYNKLENESIFLTPHIVTIQKNYTGTLSENKYLYSGMFNLGFIGMKSDKISLNVIEWWEERLKSACYKSQGESYFTDQKWIDFLPILCPSGLYISFDLGNNLAPWNFYERKLIKKDNEYYVINRIDNNSDNISKLNFVHFSGYDYSLMINGKHLQNNISSFDCPDDIVPVLLEYEKRLRQCNFSKYSNLKYSYNYFLDGSTIQEFHRRIYRRLIEDFGFIANPFDTHDSFYINLKKSKLVNVNNDKIIIQSEINPSNQKKIISLNYIFLIIYRLLGQNKYFNLLKILRRYSILENQMFLYDNFYLKNSKLRK